MSDSRPEPKRLTPDAFTPEAWEGVIEPQSPEERELDAELLQADEQNAIPGSL